MSKFPPDGDPEKFLKERKVSSSSNPMGATILPRLVPEAYTVGQVVEYVAQPNPKAASRKTTKGTEKPDPA